MRFNLITASVPPCPPQRRWWARRDGRGAEMATPRPPLPTLLLARLVLQATRAFAPDHEQARPCHDRGARIDVEAWNFAEQHVAEQERPQQRHIVERRH